MTRAPCRADRSRPSDEVVQVGRVLQTIFDGDSRGDAAIRDVASVLVGPENMWAFEANST